MNPSNPASTGADGDIVDLIDDQHDRIRHLFSELEQSPDADTLQCLVRLLAVHETAEEEIVYPEMKRHGAEAGRIADSRIVEEDKGKQVIADLEKCDTTTPEFTSKLATAKAAIDQHARHEEAEVFPVLRAGIGDDDRMRMAERFKVAEKFAPTHPHPHGPNSALGNMLTGPFVSIADHVRDAIR